MSKTKIASYGIAWRNLVHAMLNPDLMPAYDIGKIFLKKRGKDFFLGSFLHHVSSLRNRINPGSGDLKVMEFFKILFVDFVRVDIFKKLRVHRFGKVDTPDYPSGSTDNIPID
jgi:hypothetical protein